MAHSARFAFDLMQRDTAVSAARWLAAFYPEVGVGLGTDAVELQSERRDTDELGAIWAAALANELLHARGEAARRAAREALFR